jgi:hypothetical protein
MKKNKTCNIHGRYEVQYIFSGHKRPKPLITCYLDDHGYIKMMSSSQRSTDTLNIFKLDK